MRGRGFSYSIRGKKELGWRGGAVTGFELKQEAASAS